MVNAVVWADTLTPSGQTVICQSTMGGLVNIVMAWVKKSDGEAFIFSHLCLDEYT